MQSLSHRPGNLTIAAHACRALYSGVNRWPYTHLKMFMDWLCGCSTNLQPLGNLLQRVVPDQPCWPWSPTWTTPVVLLLINHNQMTQGSLA